MPVNDLQPLTPITKENVGLLKAGDWLRVVDASGSDFAAGDLVQIEGWEDLPESRVPVINNLSWRLARFTYIGPDLGDGWIGWSGGRNPVPGMRVCWQTRNEADRRYCQTIVPSSALDWSHQARRGFTPIIAFRPALSPPAEGEDRCASHKEHGIFNDPCCPHCEVPTPAPVDWQLVGPKLVDALKRIKANDPNDPAHPWNVARDALAANTPQSNGE